MERFSYQGEVWEVEDISTIIGGTATIVARRKKGVNFRVGK